MLLDNFSKLKNKLYQNTGGEPLPDWDVLVETAVEKRFSSSVVLFRQDEPSTHVYFLMQGLVRLSYETEDGRRLTKALLEEGSVFASLSALSGLKSTFTATTLEPSVIISIPFSQIQRLANSHHVWAKVTQSLYADFAASKEVRAYELLVLSAQARWLAVKANRAALISRVSQAEIAALIGVTPVALSRIKSRLLGKSAKTPSSLTPNPEPQL